MTFPCGAQRTSLFLFLTSCICVDAAADCAEGTSAAGGASAAGHALLQLKRAPPLGRAIAADPGDLKYLPKDEAVLQGPLSQGELEKMWSATWSKTVRKLSSCPQQGKHVVYLTFDDGPSDGVGNFSKKLASMGVKATFFWVQHTLDEKLKTPEGRHDLEDVLA